MGLDDWQGVNDNMPIRTPAQEQLFSFIKKRGEVIKSLLEQKKKEGEGWVDLVAIVDAVTSLDKSSGVGLVDSGANLALTFEYLRKLTREGILQERTVDPTLGDVRQRKQLNEQIRKGPPELSVLGTEKIGYKKRQLRIAYTP